LVLVGGEWSASDLYCFIPREKGPWYLLDWRLHAPNSQSGRYRGVKILEPTGTQTPTPQSSSLQPDVILTKLSWLFIMGIKENKKR
jgi:hypothetical protein